MRTIDWVICLVALAAAGVSAAILGALSGSYDWIPVRTLIPSEQRGPLAIFALCAFIVSLVVFIAVAFANRRRQAKGQ